MRKAGAAVMPSEAGGQVPPRSSVRPYHHHVAAATSDETHLMNFASSTFLLPERQHTDLD